MSSATLIIKRLTACWVIMISIANLIAAEKKLVLYYDFDAKESGAAVIDKSGAGNNGVMSAGVKLEKGISGQCAYFNGSDGLIKVRHGKSLEISNELTVCMWIKPDRIKVKYDIKAKRDSQDLTFKGWNWRCRINHLGHPELILIASKAGKKASLRLRMAQALKKNEWVHFAYVFSVPKKKVWFYINGKLVIEKDIDMDSLRLEKGWFLLGGGPGGWNPYKGCMDEIRVYNYALTQTELKEASVPISSEELVSLQEDLQKIRSKLRQHSSNATPAKKSLQIDCVFIEKQLAKAVKTGTMGFSDKNTLIKKMAFLKSVATKLKTGKITLKDTICWIVKPISSIRRLPDVFPLDGELSNRIRIVATPGEFEPASFVLMAYKDLQAVTFSTGDLTGSAGSIPANALDLKIVKCWYQGGTGWYDIMNGSSKNRVLVPELLLNDDKFIKIDKETKTNHIKAEFPDGSRYLDISNPRNMGSLLYIPVSKFPVRDSLTLQPTSLDAGKFKQFWLTCHVPKKAKPGIYSGKITVSSDGHKLGVLDVQLRVLPFSLPEPGTRYNPKREFTPSIYYKSILNPHPEAAITLKNRSAEQIKAELINMRDHGITNPLEYQLQWGFKLSRLEKVLALRAEVGMSRSALYLLGPESNMHLGDKPTEKNLAVYRKKVMQLKKISDKWNYKQLYVYGIDEAQAESVKKERRFIEEAHKLGVKVFQSGFSGPDRPNPDRYADYYPLISDLLDLIIKARPVSGVETEKWHKKGKLMWAYGVPQAGVENPLINRRNYGFLLWRNNYDGFGTYLYYGGFGNPWNDFDHRAYRDHNYVYPTSNGVVDTIAWEGVREAVDDISYATKLTLLINKAKKTGNRKAVTLAAEAKKYLDNADFKTGNLELIRLEIINRILKIKDVLK